MAPRHRFEVAGEITTVAVDDVDGMTRVRVGDDDEVVTDTTLSGVPGLMSIVIDGKPTQAYVARDGRDYRVTVEGRTFLIPTAGGGKRGRSSVGGASDPPGQVTAPLAGVVVEVRVAAGDAVEASQTLLVIEAMKMQNEIQVPTAGTITTIHCTAGERVEKGDLLVDYEPAEE